MKRAPQRVPLEREDREPRGSPNRSSYSGSPPSAVQSSAVSKTQPLPLHSF